MNVERYVDYARKSVSADDIEAVVKRLEDDRGGLALCCPRNPGGIEWWPQSDVSEWLIRVLKDYAAVLRTAERDMRQVKAFQSGATMGRDVVLKLMRGVMEGRFPKVGSDGKVFA